nr:Nad2 [Porphyridium purpureum]UBY46112.1 Nad2 [Porphyridium purpureum]
MLIILKVIPNVNIFCFDFFVHNTKLTSLVTIFILINGLVWFLSTPLSNCSYNELCILTLFCFCSYIILVLVDDLNLIYIFLEIQSLVFYLFSGLKRTSEFAIEASLRYFIIGGLVSCFLVWAYYNDNGFSNLAAIILFSLTLHFKLNVAPLHLWSPSIYEAVNTITFWHFMIFPKIISIFFMIKIISIFNVNWTSYELWLTCTGIFSLYFGGLGAYYQRVVHGIVCLTKFSYVNYFTLVFYLVTYLVTTHGILLSFLNLRLHQQNRSFLLRYLDGLVLLYKYNSGLALILTVLLFSLAGVPPFPGFIAKLLIVLSLILNKFYFSSIFVVFISFYVCYYYLKIIKQLWFNYTLTKQIFFIQTTKFQTTSLSLTLVILTFISYFPNNLSLFIEVFLFNLIYYV